MRILIAGELNADLLLQNYHSFPAPGTEVLVDDVTQALGSSSAICAAGLAKLGTEVTLASTVGADAWGELCVNTLRELAVDTSRVRREPSIKTGVTVSITSPRDRALVTYLGSIAASTARQFPDEGFAGFEHFHISSFFLQKGLRPDVKRLLGAARRCGLTTSLDPGFDPDERWGADLLDALEEVDLFLPNEVELEGVTGKKDREAALRALQNGRTLTVAK